jgi:hypothetical protein
MREQNWLRIGLILATKFIYWAAFLYSLILAALLKCNYDWVKAHIKNVLPVYDIAVNTAPITFPVVTILVVLMGSIQSKISTSKVDTIIKKLLDDFRINAFPKEDPELAYRVTIFKHYSWHYKSLYYGCLPWSGFLMPYERAGEFTMNSAAFFLAPKHDPDQCEGFAGKVFKNKRCEYLGNLPEITENSNNGTIRKYAKLTDVKESWIRNRLSKNRFPRSFWGIPIETDGCLWGVFLIDSREETLSGQEELKQHYKPLGLCLSRLLSKK